jgi:hypothetical protein
MKTKFSKAATVFALGIAMSTAAWAAQTSTHHQEQQRASEQKSEGNVFSRVGKTIVHTPSIIGETFKGERSVVSKDGLFARKPEAVAEKSKTASSSHHPQSTMKKSSSHRSKTHSSSE